MKPMNPVLDVEHGVPIKAWTRGIDFHPAAEAQRRNVARLPFVDKTRGACASIDGMAAQSDLVDVLHVLRRIVCVNG